MISQKFQQIKVLERKSVDNHFRVWYNFFRSCRCFSSGKFYIGGRWNEEDTYKYQYAL